MRTLMGIPISIHHLARPVPAVQVRDIKLRDGTSILSPAFRTEMNAWLLERFGTIEVAYMLGDNFLMNPKQVVLIKNAR